jgi:hypothetical protein
MVPGDVGVDRVAVPDEDEFAVEPVVHAGGGVELPEGDVETRTEVVDF